MKTQELFEMPARAGEGPRAILAKIWREECDKELDKMPIYRKHTSAGYRRKAKDEMVRIELHQFFKLGNLRDLVGVKDQGGRKHNVKAIIISWGRPIAWRGDGAIFKSTADYMKMIPIMREVFQRFVQRVQESGLKIMGYNSNNTKEMFSWESFDLEADLRRDSGSIELFFEESDTLLRKSEIRGKIIQILKSRQVYKKDLVIFDDDVDDVDYQYRTSRKNDESIAMIPQTVIDDLKVLAGDTAGEKHILSMIDPESEAGKEIKEKVDKIRAERIATMPEKINRGRSDLEKLLAQTSGQLENIQHYSPYEITIRIARPSDDSAEWLFRTITKMNMRDYSKPTRHPDALKYPWIKNAEWLFIRIGDRKTRNEE